MGYWSNGKQCSALKGLKSSRRKDVLAYELFAYTIVRYDQARKCADRLRFIEMKEQYPEAERIFTHRCDLRIGRREVPLPIGRWGRVIACTHEVQGLYRGAECVKSCVRLSPTSIQSDRH